MTDTTAPVTGRPPRHWGFGLPNLLAGLAVLTFGLLELGRRSQVDEIRPWTVVLGFAIGALLSRRAPGVALALVWLTGVFQLLTLTPVLLVEVAVAIVAFGTARWGRPAVVVLGGLSIPGAAIVVTFAASANVLDFLYSADSNRLLQSEITQFTGFGRAATLVAFAALLAAPWAAGLALRFLVDARRSNESRQVAEADADRALAQAEQAEEIAQLREDQARLARDVHDVVGHSLAVILAQAESAQYLPDDPETLKQTMTTIATSARTSLQDIRQVLTPSSAPVASAGLDSLVEGVRSAGHPVEVEETGTSRPLPPELDIVAYRIMQEMLTNAVRHGARDRPIRVERQWPASAGERDLRLRVTNRVGEEPNAVGPGQGVAGMRRRVEAVGGWLDIERRADAGGPVFVATAWLPVRG